MGKKEDRREKEIRLNAGANVGVRPDAANIVVKPEAPENYIGDATENLADGFVAHTGEGGIVHIQEGNFTVDEPEGDSDVLDKSLGNTDASGATKNVKDIVFWGDGDTFKLISKASSKKEGWMKSTKALEIPNLGCVVQVTTQQWGNVAEAVTFVPGAAILTNYSDDGIEVISRELIRGRIQ